MNNILFSSINTTGVIGISYDTLSSFVGKILYFSGDGEILIVDPKTSSSGKQLNKYLSHSGDKVIKYVFEKLDVEDEEQNTSLDRVAHRAANLQRANTKKDWDDFINKSVIIQKFQVDVELEPDNYTKACYAILNLLMITNKIMSVITEMNYSLSPFAVDNRSWWSRLRGDVNVETWLYYVKDCYKVNSGNQQLLSTYFLDEIINAPAVVNAKDLCKLLYFNCLKMVSETSQIADDDDEDLKNLGFPDSQHNSPLLESRFNLSKQTTNTIISKADITGLSGFEDLPSDFDLLSLLPVITYEVVKESSGGVLFTNTPGHVILKSVTATFKNKDQDMDKAHAATTAGDSMHDFTTGNRPGNLKAFMIPYPDWWQKNIGRPFVDDLNITVTDLDISKWTSDPTMKSGLFTYLDSVLPSLKSARGDHRLDQPDRDSSKYATSNAAPTKLVQMYKGKELLTIGQLIDSAIQMGDPKKLNDLLKIPIGELDEVVGNTIAQSQSQSQSQPTIRNTIMYRLNEIINRFLGQNGGFAANGTAPKKSYKLKKGGDEIILDDNKVIIDKINEELEYNVTLACSTGDLFHQTIIKYIILQTYETGDKKIGFRLIITEYKVIFGKMWDPTIPKKFQKKYQWEADYLTSKITYNDKSYKFRTGRSLDSNMIRLDLDEKLYIKSILKTIFPKKDIETFLLLEGCPLFTSGGNVAKKIEPDATASENIKRICEISGQHLKFTGDGTQETLWILYQQILGEQITKLNNDELSAIKDYINAYNTKNGGLTITNPSTVINAKALALPHSHEQWTKTNQNWVMYAGKVKQYKKKSKNMKGGSIYTLDYLSEQIELYLMDYTDIYNSSNIIYNLKSDSSFNDMLNKLTIELNKYCLCDLDEWLDIGEILFVSLKEKYDDYIINFIKEQNVTTPPPPPPPTPTPTPTPAAAPGSQLGTAAAAAAAARRRIVRSKSLPATPPSPPHHNRGDDDGTITPTPMRKGGAYLKKSKRNNHKKSRRNNHKKSRRNKNKKSRRNKNKKSRRNNHKKSRRNKNKKSRRNKNKE